MVWPKCNGTFHQCIGPPNRNINLGNESLFDMIRMHMACPSALCATSYRAFVLLTVGEVTRRGKFLANDNR